MDSKKAVNQSNNIVDGIVTISEKIKNKSEKLKNNAIDKTILVNETKKPYTASSLVSKDVDSELKKIIKDTNKDFNDFIESMSRYLLNNFSINLTKKDLNAIASKGSLIIEDLVANTTILKKDIQKILTQNLAKGISKSVLITQLKDLYPAYERNASTLINTGLSRTFIDTNVAKFKESDFDWYVYAGPDDKLTRETPCKHWVWHRFPASQLPQVMAVRMRLWNCRHNIIPISKEEIKDYPKLNLKYA
jgi:hypothetical protein